MSLLQDIADLGIGKGTAIGAMPSCRYWGNGGAGGDNPSGVGGNGGDGGKGGSGDDGGNPVEVLTGMVNRKVRQRLEKRPDNKFMKTIPLIRKAKLVGNGIAVEAPKGYRSRGRYPAGLNEQNCPNFPFCRWVP